MRLKNLRLLARQMGISFGLVVAFLFAMFIAAWISWILIQALRKLFKRP